MSKIKVLIVDDHTMVREGLVSVFSSDESIEVIGQANDGDEAVIQTQNLSPDVVLMDINMPKLNGIEAAEKIKIEKPFVKILLLTMLNSRRFVLEALQKNIDGYILKMADVEELKEAIVRIHKGDYYFDREITEELIMSETISDKYSKEIDDLTEREREIMLFIAQGMSSAEIGERLKISANTIYNHRRSIFKKLDCKNSAEIVNIAIKSGLYRV